MQVIASDISLGHKLGSQQLPSLPTLFAPVARLPSAAGGLICAQAMPTVERIK